MHNKHYFKDYYQKNKHKFQARNRNRTSKRKYCYVININEKNFCFYCKKDIQPVRVPIETIDKKGYILAKT